MRPDYTIHLERVFQGPMDLLLHLVREQEVEIHEIQIARVLKGYMAYLESLEQLDIEYAADFLVMAATLMAIKSRSLLTSDEINLEEELDPRDELIQRLIEFRRFKYAAEAMDESRRLRERMFDRGAHPELGELPREREFDLGELTAFDLLAQYSRLMRETLADRPHQVMVDEHPMRFYVEQVVSRLKTVPRIKLKDLVATLDVGRQEALIGSFCALLELVRLQAIEVHQPSSRADIEIEVREGQAEHLDEIVSGSVFAEEIDASAAAAEAAEGEPEAPAAVGEDDPGEDEAWDDPGTDS